MTEIIDGEQAGRWLSCVVETATELKIVAPFITRAGIEPLAGAFKNRGPELMVTIIGNIDLSSIIYGSLHADALAELMDDEHSSGRVTVQHLPDLHAKVMLASFPGGKYKAILGSSNLTGAGTSGKNVELGIEVLDADMPALKARVDAWLAESQERTADELRRLHEIAFTHYKHLMAARRLNPGRFQIFPGPEGKTYYDQLRAILQKADRDKGLPVAELKKLLRRGQHRGDNTVTNRMVALQMMGLVTISDDIARATPLGRELRTKSKDGAAKVFGLLHDKFPDFAAVYEELLLHPKEDVTYDQLRAWLSDDSESGPNAARWMLALEVAHAVGDAHRNHGNEVVFRLSEKYEAK